MSSPDRVLLRATAVDAGATPVVVSAPTAALDDTTRALIDDAHARGVAEGRTAGAAAGRREVQAAADGLRAAVVTAVEGFSTELRSQHGALASALEARVLAAVTAVLGHEPTDGRRLAEALARAVAGVRSPRLEVRVAAAHAELVTAALADVAEVEVVVDQTLGSDDARVLGPDVLIDLRRERLLAELAEVLAAGAPLGPLGDASSDAAPAEEASDA